MIKSRKATAVMWALAISLGFSGIPLSDLDATLLSGAQQETNSDRRDKESDNIPERTNTCPEYWNWGFVIETFFDVNPKSRVGDTVNRLYKDPVTGAEALETSLVTAYRHKGDYDRFPARLIVKYPDGLEVTYNMRSSLSVVRGDPLITVIRN